MGSLLGRELTAAEEKVKSALEGLLESPEKRPVHAIRDFAATSPNQFTTAALALLESLEPLPDRRRLYLQLIECPEFLREVAEPSRFSRAQFLKVCRELKKIDDFVDVRLARLAPGRHEDEHGLAPEALLRLLEVLHVISSGPRLILIVSHLAQHPDQRVASKAAMLIGGRLRNDRWLQKQVESRDPRMRASIVEGLWGVNTPFARQCMRGALKDENNRVAGNGLLGLHLLQEPGVDQMVQQMLADTRPNFRSTAAWLMGKIGKPEFESALVQATTDQDPGVRHAAKTALKAMPKPLEPEKPAVLPPEEAAVVLEPVEPEPAELAIVETEMETPVELEPALQATVETETSEPAELIQEETAEEEEISPEEFVFVPKFDGRYVR